MVRASIWQIFFPLLQVVGPVATDAMGHLGYKYAEESLKAEIFDSLPVFHAGKKRWSYIPDVARRGAGNV